jgi:hypothetical protein
MLLIGSTAQAIWVIRWSTRRIDLPDRSAGWSTRLARPVDRLGRPLQSTRLTDRL